MSTSTLAGLVGSLSMKKKKKKLSNTKSINSIFLASSILDSELSTVVCMPKTPPTTGEIPSLNRTINLINYESPHSLQLRSVLFVQPSPLHKSKNSPNHVYRIYFSSNKLFVLLMLCRTNAGWPENWCHIQHNTPPSRPQVHTQNWQQTTEIGNHVKSTFESILSLACLVSSNRLLAINYDHYS